MQCHKIYFLLSMPGGTLPCGYVHPTYSYPRRRRVLHLPPRALRTHRQQGAPTYPARSRTALRCRTKPVADALPAHRRNPRRPAAPVTGLPLELEAHDQRITAALLAEERVGTASPPTDWSPDLQQVDVNSLEVLRPRSVGVEHARLWAMEKLALLNGWASPPRSSRAWRVRVRSALPGAGWLSAAPWANCWAPTLKRWARCARSAPPMP